MEEIPFVTTLASALVIGIPAMTAVHCTTCKLLEVVSNIKLEPEPEEQEGQNLKATPVVGI